MGTTTSDGTSNARDVYIVGAARTPVGSFGGSLSGIPATELGAIAIKGMSNDHCRVDVSRVRFYCDPS